MLQGSAEVRRMTRTFLPAALLVAGLAGASPASANPIPRDEGFMREPAAVQNRLFSLDGKNDLAAFFAFSVNANLTRQFHLMLNYDRGFNEYFALDVLAGGGYGGLNSFANKIRDAAQGFGGVSDPIDLGIVREDLEDAGALLATGQLGLRFTPVYGKLSLFSELPVHFNAYIVGGVGAALVQYNGILKCGDQGLNGKTCGEAADFFSETKPTLGFNFGAGFRFFVNETISARIEFRDIVFPDHWYKNPNADVNASPDDAPQEQSGITHLPMLMLGVGFLL